MFPLLPQKIRLVHRLLPTIVPFAFRPTVLTGFFLFCSFPQSLTGTGTAILILTFMHRITQKVGAGFCEIWERDSPWTTEEFLNFGMQW